MNLRISHLLKYATTVLLIFAFSCKKTEPEAEIDRLEKLRTVCEREFQPTCNTNTILTDDNFTAKIKEKEVCIRADNDGYKGYFGSPEIVSSSGGSAVAGQGSNVNYTFFSLGIWGTKAVNTIGIQSPQLPLGTTRKEFIDTYLVPGKYLPIKGDGRNNINLFSVSYGMYCDDPLRNGKNENGWVILTSGYLMFGSWAGVQPDDAYLKVVNVEKFGDEVYRVTFEMKCKLYSESDKHYFGELTEGKFSMRLELL